MSQSVIHKLRTDLFNKMTKVSVITLIVIKLVISSCMSYDIDDYDLAFSRFINMITSVITVVVSFIMMLITSPLLLGIFFITIPVSFIVTNSYPKSLKRDLELETNN